MDYLALASDYDGTLATQGRVNSETLLALEQFRTSGRKLILVTGREISDLLHIFPQVDLFDCIVAENGALLYWPASQQERLLGSRPPDELIIRLRDRQVHPLSVGRVIVATWQPHETTVREAIRDLKLALQVIFNKNAIMILPSGINNATGLSAACQVLQLSPHQVVGVGDAENDLVFLNLCGYAVAVANALPEVKAEANLITSGSRGAGIIELIEQLLAPDQRQGGD
jgi:HAD superfamily hydrolase (TIGR01484 family)